MGKTTTAINLSACLAMMGQKVLLVDFDPQGNATTGVGLSDNGNDRDIYRVLVSDLPLPDSIQPTEIKNFSVVPATIDLYGAEMELASLDQREKRLRMALEPERNKYDFIFIDCPPSLSILTLNCLNAADSTIIPMQTEFYALEGLAHLLKTVHLVRKTTNPGLEVEGILFTMCDHRTLLANQVISDVTDFFPDLVLKTVIPRNVRLSEAPSHGKPIVLYDRRSKGAEAYIKLANEILKRCRKRRLEKD